LSDTKALINSAAFPTTVDGLNRVVRVARSTTQTLSMTNGKYVSFSSSKPTISTVVCRYSAGSYLNAANATGPAALDVTPNNTGNPLRRDESITITGSGFLGCKRIWLENLTGGGFVPPVDINQSDFLARGIVVVSDSLITMSANAIQSTGADGFGVKQARLKLANDRDSSNPFGPFHVNIQPTVTTLTGLGNYDGNNTFNRGSIDPLTGALIGDEVVISGTGLGAIKFVRIQAVDSLDQYASPPDAGRAQPTPAGVRGANIAAYPPTITRMATGSTPGVFLAGDGTTLRVQTGTTSGYGTAAFASAGNADANTTTRLMQFKLQCEDTNRTIQFTPGDAGNSFIVGVTPVVGVFSIAGMNFQRDMDNASITGGSGLRLIDEVEFVDQNNLTIAGAGTDLTFFPTHGSVASNLIETDVDGVRLDLNGTVIGWANASKQLSDNITAGSRLIKVTTPWGATSLHTAVIPQAFRISGAIQFSGAGGVDAYGASFILASGNDRWINMRNGVGALDVDTITATFSSNPAQAALGASGSLYGNAFGGGGNTGGGYDFNGSDAVNAAVNNTGLSTTMRDLIITGSGFRGVSAISFMDTANRSYQWPNLTQIPVDPQAGTPAGITINAAGTQMTITGTYIHSGNNTWARQSESLNPGVGVLNLDRKIRLFTPSGAYNETPTLDTNATQ